MHGTNIGAFRAKNAGMLRKMLAALLSLVLIASLAPTYALAETDGGVVGGAQATFDSASESHGEPDGETQGSDGLEESDFASVSAGQQSVESFDRAPSGEGGEIPPADQGVSPGVVPPAQSEVLGAEDSKVSATFSVTGVDGQGVAQAWLEPDAYELDEGATAADLSEAAFAAAGLAADFGEGAYGWYLNTITSPFDGRVLGWDEATGSYWKLTVNGEYSQVGASSVVLAEGDEVAWVYGPDKPQTPEGKVAATMEVVGEDASGTPQRWTAQTEFELDEGATAADLSEAAFAAAGLAADFGEGAYGWYLNTITSPFDGRVLGWDEATGKYWCLYVNGVQSELGASGVVLAEGDELRWSYTTYGADLPDADDVVVDPSAPRPDYEAEHPMFGGSTQGGNVTAAPTPTTGTQLNWSYDFGDGLKSGSDPLIVNGNLYVVAGSTLRVIDAQTGRETARTSIGSQAGYFCRPAYANGVIIVPREDGSLAAFTADTLACVWVSRALDALESHGGNQFQALSTLTVNGGYAYAGFTMAGSLGASFDLSVAGALVCVDVNDGRVVWTKVSDSAQTGEAAGYYWAGAASSGDDIVIGDESGTVSLVDGATGEVLSSVSGLGGAVRSGAVSVPGNDDMFLVVSRENGTLHKVEREGDALVLKGSVPFAVESTSTPAIAGGKAFVCGVDAQGYGTISVVDLATMTVVSTARAGYGKAQAAPLVSVTGGKTYAYFTCNGQPGGVYAYCLEDGTLAQIYVPDEAHRQYSTSTVVADAQGRLYYANDSGALFSLSPAESWKVTFDSCGGSAVGAVYVVKGQTLAQPADPAREGFSFAGWHADAACTQAWDFSQAPTQDMTLFAKWATTQDEGDSNAVADENGRPGAVSGSQGNAAASANVVRTVLLGKAAPSATTASSQADSDAMRDDAAATEAAAKPRSGEAKATSAGAADDADGVRSGQEGSMPWWPFVGLAVGVCGLAVALIWGVKTRKGNGR
ncbi:MAG: DUF4430 domain-containing protein [Slackia sp.]|nr:DUF4430 domain-containing protein [Slackia sp.]